MPGAHHGRGGGGGGGGRRRGGSAHKGASRNFTSAEEVIRQAREIEIEKKRREAEGDVDEEGQGGRSEPVVSILEKPTAVKEISSSEESDESDEDDKHKGVQHLISVDNPNRQKQRMKKLKDLDAEPTAPAAAPAPEAMSRREREAIEAEIARRAYEKAHAAGQTEQAQKDLARLAIVRQQREEAKRTRDEDKKAKEAASLQRNPKK